MATARERAPLPADNNGARALPLPRLLVLTDRLQSQAAGRTLADTVAAVAHAGAPAVLFREKDLGRDRRSLAHEVASALAGTDTKLVVATDPRLAFELGAWGVHLGATDSLPSPTDPGDDVPVGRSCHSAAEVAAAAREGAAWATLSPVFTTASKPGHGPAIGTAALAGHPLPVFALGGVGVTSAASCIAAGAHGVAVMGAVMTAPDPAAVVHDLLECIGAATAAEASAP